MSHQNDQPRFSKTEPSRIPQRLTKIYLKRLMNPAEEEMKRSVSSKNRGSWPSQNKKNSQRTTSLRIKGGNERKTDRAKKSG
ncbi:unnamed protein product [Blepharisma stoltei]|uniref:Uncharacterized protein n=1 Tax=Blepharisma stoltei TaxID=1481888 RepID=A0AAU9JRD5_9CILI|nr:unnamed protein product [Blepharisma stoltei]